MNFESSLYYVTHHSESIIQWLFLAILLMASYLIYRTMFAKKEEAAAAVSSVALSDGSDIQKFLQRILDQTAKLEGISLDKANPAGAAQFEAQVASLKAELKSKEDDLAKAKAAGDGKVSADADKLNARIKELEGKLAEYEILEDDIADLSLYKEENARLRGELDKLKSGGPAPAAAPAGGSTPDRAPLSAAEELALANELAAVSENQTAPATPAEDPAHDIVAEFAQAVSQETNASTGPMVQVKETGDPMADFEAAVKAEKQVQSEAKPAEPIPIQSAKPAAAPAPAPVAAPVAAVPAAQAPAGAPAEADDLFAEFAQPTPDAEEGQGSLDTDKMMAEMAALVGMEPAKGSALEDHNDLEKMAAEATKLGNS